jgi:hypothetical protein
MRKLSFIFAVFGISLLFVLLFIGIEEIEGVGDLDSLELNQKVSFIGIVDSERDFGSFRILSVKEIDVVCECSKSYLGLKVEIVGVVGEFNGVRQVEALSIDIIK